MWLNPWPTLRMGQVVTFSKVDDRTSQPVTFNGYPSTSGCLTGLRNKPQGITPNVENNEARSKPQASGNSL